MSYDEVLRLCEEALSELDESRSLQRERVRSSEGPREIERSSESSDPATDDKDIARSITVLTRQIEDYLDSYKKTFEKYEELKDVEDLELDAIVEKVNQLQSKIEKTIG